MGFVYAFFDNELGLGTPIYVGKTEHLANRLYQHFGAKTKYLLQDAERVKSVRYSNVGEHYDLVETHLIHKYRPILNKFFNCYSENVTKFFGADKDIKDLNCMITMEQIKKRFGNGQ